MYSLSNQQIEFILDDIRARGVETEDLQLNLLDHVCCMIEGGLEENGDFRRFYSQSISSFYRKELRELEDETQFLLTFKHYYTMKKIMFFSGAVSVAAFIFGSFFKVMHWPGANMLLFVAMFVSSFIFLPLFSVLKAREVKSTKDKIVVALGTITGMIWVLSTMFKIFHWPYANMLWFCTLLSFFVFIPVYFFSGIRNPETKVNTITSSILLVVAFGLMFSLTSIRKSRKMNEMEMYAFYKNEILMKRLMHSTEIKDPKTSTLVSSINSLCEQLKGLIFINEIGIATIPDDFESQQIAMYERPMSSVFGENGTGRKLLSDLRDSISLYNDRDGMKEEYKIPVDHSLLEAKADELDYYSNISALITLTHVQMSLAGSAAEQIAQK